MVSSQRTLLGLALFALAGCEMQPAEVLDEPRIIAIRATPPGWAPDTAFELEALVWNDDAEVMWSSCSTAWVPTDPISCPAGAQALGAGNPLTVAPGTLADGVWLRADAGAALPAVQLLKTGPDAVNPAVSAIVSADGGPLAATIPVGSEVEIAVAFEDGGAGEQIVTSWYVTGGELLPARTVGTQTTIWTMPDVRPASALTLIGVSRAVAGGVTWIVRTLEVQ